MKEKSKNILYLSYDGMTDPLGQSQVLPYLIGLTKEGFTFHIISFEKQHRFEEHRTHIQKICDDNGIFWHPNRYSQKSPLVTTIWDVYKMKKLALKLHAQHNFFLVHCRSYISALVGLSMKKRQKTKFVFDMRGFWADERVDGGLWNLNVPIYKLVYSYFKKKEIRYFKESDYTVSLTKKGKEEIESWPIFTTQKPKIKIIPCCVDLALFDPESITTLQKENRKQMLNLKADEFVIGYVGSIGTWYMLSEMLDFFKMQKESKPNAKFLFVTGEKPSKIHEKAVEKGILMEDVIVTSCLHKDVPLNISIFDVSIFFIRPTYSKKASSPTKQGEIMAMGIPLICNGGVGDTDEIVKHYQAGQVVYSFEKKDFERIIESPELVDLTKMKEGAREFYSLEQGISNYLEIYKEIYANEK